MPCGDSVGLFEPERHVNPPIAAGACTAGLDRLPVVGLSGEGGFDNRANGTSGPCLIVEVPQARFLLDLSIR